QRTVRVAPVRGDVMALDAKQVQAIFFKAVEALDPVQQAAILARECAADLELRQRVEALLAAHRGPPGIPEPPAGAPAEPPGLPTAGTAPLAGMTDPGETSLVTPRPDPGVTYVQPAEGEGPIALYFLLPSSRPGSLGRLGHYEVLELLGRGGFGIVVRALDDV